MRRVKRRGRASRVEATRARVRFMAAEERGQDPWQATARRINAMRKPAKIAGMRAFLDELLQERPNDRTEILDLLGMVGGLSDAGTYQGQTVPTRRAKRSRTPKTGNAFLDLCADLDERGATSCSVVGDESPMASVLLAKKYKTSTNPAGWWMSEKLDGVRAIWDGSSFWSRTGKPFNAPKWYRDAMPPNVVLDGELFAGRGQFRDTISAVRRKIPNDKQWVGIVYKVFDMPDERGSFEARMRKLERVVAMTPRGAPIQVVKQIICTDRTCLRDFHNVIAAGGGEGVMLRQAGSPYERKRSSTLLKVKDFVDEEARITGHQRGEGKHRGRLGAYHAELLSTGVRFKVGTGLSDAQRERPLPKGATITVRYQELTPDGVPRFPVFIAARDYE